MLRPKRERPNTTQFAKAVRIFGLLMTTMYMVFGVFIIFADESSLNLNITDNVRYMLGGILILYSIVRFVRLYQSNSNKGRNRYEE
ncbi:hypothetical protein [Pontibacter burrus]|uniref:Uncharacterized protein n=1 Tax=Pontibacter burrus TaxID=2704466 RepID=A0A6B3LRX8_9BACT|nr:hypothetical protein [Pontibacter burrus]NEM99592.1 hypothetical protein [Pontibacter burrus]